METKASWWTLKRRQAVWAYIFILVPLAFYLIIRILPVASAFNISLHKWDILSKSKPFVGLDNFVYMMNDKVFKIALMNTFKYVIIAVPIGLFISLGISLLLNRLTKGSGFFRMIYFIPYVTSAVAVSWTWRWMFLKQGGVVNGILKIFGVQMQPFLTHPSQAMYVVISNIVWQSVGFYTIIFLAGLKQIPVTYYEAAAIDGAKPHQQFFRITIPLLNPTIVYLSVMATIQTLQAFSNIFNITSGNSGMAGGPLNSTLSLVVYIYMTAFKSHNMGYASAMTVVLFCIILTISIIQLKFLTRKFDY